MTMLACIRWTRAGAVLVLALSFVGAAVLLLRARPAPTLAESAAVAHAAGAPGLTGVPMRASS